VVPHNLIDYFAASATVAGALIGLLFVSISLRYDAILGASANDASRATAAAGFTGLVNALTISLWALIPGDGLGYAAAVSAVLCVYRTLRLHVGRSGRRETSLASFLFSLAVFLTQLGTGTYLIVNPHSVSSVDVLAYTLFGAFASALSRSWALLEVGSGQSSAPPASPKS